MSLNKNLLNYLAELEKDSIQIERKQSLDNLVDYIQAKVKAKEEIRLTFICTHNSRRSHFAQIWAQALAKHFMIPMVDSYSGGTERTVLFPMVIETLKKAGFDISTLCESENPIYAIKYSSNDQAVIGFSKEYDNEFNPSSNFAAIMTCSQADEGCPFVAGAEKRVSLPFEDPKMYDDTAEQVQKYEACSRQIATELRYVFSRIKA